MVAKKTSHVYSSYHNYQRCDDHNLPVQENYGLVRKTGLRNSRKAKDSNKNISIEITDPCKEDEIKSKGKIKRITDKFKGLSPQENEKGLESSNVILDSSWGTMLASTRNIQKSNVTSSASKDHQQGYTDTRPRRKSTSLKTSKPPRRIKETKNSRISSDSNSNGPSKSKIQTPFSNILKKASLRNNHDKLLETNIKSSRQKFASSDKIKPIERPTGGKILTESKEKKEMSQPRRVTWNLKEISPSECGDNNDKTQSIRKKFASLSEFLLRSESTDSCRSSFSGSYTTQTNGEDDEFDLVKEIFMCTHNACVGL